MSIPAEDIHISDITRPVEIDGKHTEVIITVGNRKKHKNIEKRKATESDDIPAEVIKSRSGNSQTIFASLDT